MPAKRKILILGGGFGGIKSALELSRDDKFEVCLISERDHLRYYPTLYHAATGGQITSSKIMFKDIFKDSSVRLIIDEVRTLDRENKKVVAKKSTHSYDELIISLGVVTNYFGIKGLEQYAYGIKSLPEAKRLRDHLHRLLLDEGKPDLNYVIIGGGPTGVELAGALPGYLKHIMQRHGISKRSLHIDLVEASPRLMSRMSKRYSRKIARRLRGLGVKLYLSQQVQAETADQLVVSGHSIASHTVVWTAGVANHPFFKDNEFTLSDHGKVVVDQYLQAEENIYVIGDNADTVYSGMAQTALYDAVFVAKNLQRLVRGQNRRFYTPKRPVYVTPAGPHWAAVSWGPFDFFGRLGWLVRIAAEFVGYKDFESWRRAAKHLASELEDGDDCQVCTGKQATK